MAPVVLAVMCLVAMLPLCRGNRHEDRAYRKRGSVVGAMVLRGGHAGTTLGDVAAAANESTVTSDATAATAAAVLSPADPAPTALRVVSPRSDPVDDFPTEPPCLLAELTTSRSEFPTLGAGENTTIADHAVGMRVRRKIFTVTGRDLTVANASGYYNYATEGSVFTFHSHTYLYEADTGRRLALISTTLLAIHRIFEVTAYEPVCHTQAPSSERDDGDVLMYPAFRLTKIIFSLYPSWTLEKYKCDGSLETAFVINTRYWFQLYRRYDVRVPGQELPSGTIDQSYIFQWSPNYDVWLAKGENPTVFALLAVLVDMNVLFEEQSKKNDHHRHGGRSGGSTFDRHAGAVGAAMDFH